MKKNCRFLVIIGLACCLFSCSPLEIEFNDPQEIETIHDAFLSELNGSDNDDMVLLFGEENINFGPIPPQWSDDICFRVEGMEYDTCIRYIFDIYNNNQPILSHADPPTYDGAINTHLFYDQDLCLFKHKMRIHDTYGVDYNLDLDKAQIIGHDNKFTIYYKGKIQGNGDPTVVMLISGSPVYDTITTNNTQTLVFKGVQDYIFGKKILDYDSQPTNAYAPGTIEIKKHPGLSPSCEWDSK